MLKITTWNVNGIRARESDVLEWVRRELPDVVCLQEVKAGREQIPAALAELSEHWCYWHGHKGYSGVALLLSKRSFPECPRFEHPEFDHETRIVTASVGDMLFASIYVPNGGKDFPAKVRFLDALFEFAARAREQRLRIVLCGDLNVAREPRDVHPSLQKPEQIGQTPGERAQLEKIIGCDLVDLLRSFHSDDDRLFTWWAPWRNLRERNVGWRLDYVLASSALAATATACDAFREYGSSDHGPVVASFDVAVPRGAPGGGNPQPPPSRDPQLALF